MSIKLKSILAVAMLLAGILLAGCNANKALTGEAKETVLAYADPIADGLLQGISAKDFPTFSKDFDSTMQSKMTVGSFETLAQSFDQKLGAYQSKKVEQVLDTGVHYTMLYTLVYEKAPKVTFRLVLGKEEPHQVSGIWFTAPELK